MEGYIKNIDISTWKYTYILLILLYKDRIILFIIIILVYITIFFWPVVNFSCLKSTMIQLYVRKKENVLISWCNNNNKKRNICQKYRYFYPKVYTYRVFCQDCINCAERESSRCVHKKDQRTIFIRRRRIVFAKNTKKEHHIQCTENKFYWSNEHSLLWT